MPTPRLLPALAFASVLLSTAPAFAQGSPELAGCPVFPPDNAWNTRVDGLPVHPLSATYVASIGSSAPLKADFGAGLWEGGPIGIPYTVVDSRTPKVPMQFGYADESDPGPYPIPPNAAIEGGAGSSGDRHVLVLDRSQCLLYETGNAYPQADGSWQGGGGAIFDLRANALRPADWTSADAAGLPILPGLVRYDEVQSGEIRHALRVTAPRTQKAYVWPARHQASARTDTSLPPMGQRFRLKASYDISGFDPSLQILLRAMQRYGLILADNGSAWYVSGVPDERWDNDLLHTLGRIPGSAFEAVDVTPLMPPGSSADPSGRKLTSAAAQGPLQWSASATASGPLTARSLSARITVAPNHQGQTGNLYLAGQIQSQWFFLTHDGAGQATWAPFQAMPPSPWQSGALASSDIPLSVRADLSPLLEGRLYGGYGLSPTEMLSAGRYSLIYTVAP